MNRAAVSIPEKLFFKIGEVCDIIGVQAHVLRYWESEFPMLAPQKNRAGQRTYRKRDVEMALRIKELLYEDQYTIAGAKKKLTSELRGASKLKVVTPEMSASLNAAPPQQQPAPLPTPPSGTSSSAPQFLAGRSEASPAPASSGNLSEEQRVALQHLKGQLRDLLTLLDTTDTSSSVSRK